MKVFYHIDEFNCKSKNVVTTGTFDGVHLGHNTVIRKLKKAAAKINGETTLLTFHPHPRLVLFPNNVDLKLLNTQKEKINLLEKAGIDNLIIHPFTEEFSKLSSIHFIRDILANKLKTNKLVIGYDHRFGKNREGSFEHLMEFGDLYGFETEEIAAHDVKDINVSSTKIRKALEKGDISTANQYLGYNFPLTGKVIKGNQLGRTIGFPTANISTNKDYKIIPKDGAYCAFIKTDNNIYQGMVNIGTNPTVNNTSKKSIEVHLFNFNGDLYNKEITIEFIKKLRDEIKFNGVEQLTAQLRDDQIQSLQILKQ